MTPPDDAARLTRRRGWDSNPRGSFHRPRDFQSRTLSHSVTSPGRIDLSGEVVPVTGFTDRVGADQGEWRRGGRNPMSATLHLATYPPRGAIRMLRAMQRHRRELKATPGCAGVQLLPTVNLEPRFGGIPTPTRWALFCGWRDNDARDEFFAGAPALEAFVDSSDECWGVALETVRVVNRSEERRVGK